MNKNNTIHNLDQLSEPAKDSRNDRSKPKPHFREIPNPCEEIARQTMQYKSICDLKAT